MIPELMILLTVQYFQKRRECIALVIVADLIDLIQQDKRILHSRLPESVSDPSWHCPHIGLSMPADLSLVTHAAK